jgi:hypothetical protein
VRGGAVRKLLALGTLGALVAVAVFAWSIYEDHLVIRWRSEHPSPVMVCSPKANTPAFGSCMREEIARQDDEMRRDLGLWFR